MLMGPADFDLRLGGMTDSDPAISDENNPSTFSKLMAYRRAPSEKVCETVAIFISPRRNDPGSHEHAGVRMTVGQTLTGARRHPRAVRLQ